MRLTTMFLLGIAGAVSGAAEKTPAPKAAASSEIAAPALGFVTAGSGNELRPVFGSRLFPGLGNALALPPDAKRVLLAGNQSSALVEMADNWSILPVRSGATSAVTVLSRPARLAAISPSGTAAAFLLQESDRVAVVAGLPSAPRIAFESDLPHGITCLAVADNADAAVGCAPNGVLLIRAERSGLLHAGTPVVAAFVPNSLRAVIADHDGGRVLSLVAADGATSTELASGSSHGIDAPYRVAVDSRGMHAVVLTAHSLVVVSLQDGQVRTVASDFKPADVASLGESGLFAIRAKDGDGTWLLGLDTPEPRLLYSPALER